MALTGTVNNVGNDTADLPSEQQAGAVLYTPQNLSPTQRAQALANIGATSTEAANDFINEVSFDIETGSFTFASASRTQNFELPQFNAVRNIDFIDGGFRVEFNDSSLNKVIELPANSSAIIINGIEPIDGRVTIGVQDIPDLRDLLASKATNSDLEVVRGLKVTSNEVEQTLTIFDALDVPLHTFNVAWLANANVLKTPISEVFRISEAEASQPNVFISLKEIPNENEFVNVFINGLYVNSEDVLLDGQNLVIARTNVEYGVKEGMQVTVNYKY